MTGCLTVVGVGPGDPELMTLKAVRAIREADVVAYPETRTTRLAADTAADAIGARRRLPFAIPMTGDGAAAAAYDDAASAIRSELAAGRLVALLCEGDPSLYGSASAILDRLPDVDPVIVPGVTAASAVAAIARVPLARGDEPLTIVPATAGPAALRRALSGRGGVVVYKLGRHAADLQRAARGAGRSGTVVVHATRDAQERVALEAVEGPLPYFSACILPAPEPTASCEDAVAVVVLNDSGLQVARTVHDALRSERRHVLVHGPAHVAGVDVAFAHAPTAIARLFREGRSVVGVCAAGILIRAAADVLGEKQAEPALVAVADDGSAVVPLLNAHRGGSAIARTVALALGTQAAVTALSDVRLGVALDDPPEGYAVADPGPFKSLAAALGGGAGVNAPGIPFLEGVPRGTQPVRATVFRHEIDPVVPTYVARRVALGMGASRGADPERAVAAVRRVLDDVGVDPRAVALVASVDLKADERAIEEVADDLDVPLRLFDREVLARQEPRLASPSEVVRQAVGIAGVAEAAALAAAGPHGRLLATKRVCGDVTIALGLAPEPIAPTVGRARGRLVVVGVGPGSAEWRTGECVRALATADDLVGYTLYLDLIDDVRAPHQRRHDFPLGGEAERVRVALALAAQGRTVALVSSGDPGVYAMAALAAEMLDGDATDDPARRVALHVVPGVTAAQAAAARVGAPLGHDFAMISLSDLLTPWAVIERRLQAAADGDFAVALYNPRSQRRSDQLGRAFAILSAARPPSTPVVIASSVGRPGEAVDVTTLAEADPRRVDMLSIVLVGASRTRAFVRGDGTRVVYTPRGYAV